MRSVVFLAAVCSAVRAGEPGAGPEWPPRAQDIAQLVQQPAAGLDESGYLQRVEKLQQEQADFRRRLKELGLVFRRSCTLHQNTVLDLGYHELEFLSADGRYARLRLRYRVPFAMDYAPVLTIVGDPAGQDFELKGRSIADFLAKTDDLGLVKKKLAGLAEKVGPAVKAVDGAEGCSGESWHAVPIEVR